MGLERIVDKMLWVEAGHVAEEIAIAHQHERAIHACPDDRGSFARAHRIGEFELIEVVVVEAMPKFGIVQIAGDIDPNAAILLLEVLR